MYSSVIQGTMYKDFKNIKQLLGISEERLTDMLYGMSSEEFSVLIEKYYKDIELKILKASEKDKERLYEIHNAVISLDVNRSYIQSLHFMLSEKAFGNEADFSVLADLEQEDMLFDFESKNFLVRISRCRYKREVGGKFYQSYKGTVTAQLPGENDFATIEFDFVLEKLPRIFIYGEYMGACEEYCKKCNPYECRIEILNGNTRNSGPQVLCSKRVRDTCVCSVNQLVIAMTAYSIDELLSACAYAVGLYVNRRKRTTNKTSSSGVKIKRKIHEPSKCSNDVKMLTLKEYNYYEKKEKIEWQGGHHNSPIEHERSGHFRHYKSGKVVWVNSCTVNKDKGKGIYKV